MSLQEICDWLMENTNALSIAFFDHERRLLGHAGARVNEATMPVLDELSSAALFERDETRALLATRVGQATLYVLFDARTSLGLVRLRVKKATEMLKETA